MTEDKKVTIKADLKRLNEEKEKLASYIALLEKAKTLADELASKEIVVETMENLTGIADKDFEARKGDQKSYSLNDENFFCQVVSGATVATVLFQKKSFIQIYRLKGNQDK